jgi:DNA-binding transcriptional MerR regulator
MRDPVERKAPSPGGGGGGAADHGRREPRRPTGTMSIGEVLAILKPEFADITVSKIRFLEGAGLVQPDRSASGYRKFSDDDVARLRFVLRAQRDQYLPLRVIRQRLADLEQVGGLQAKGAPTDAEAPGQESATGPAGGPGAPAAAAQAAAAGPAAASPGAAGPAAGSPPSGDSAGGAGASGAAPAAGPGVAPSGAAGVPAPAAAAGGAATASGVPAPGAAAAAGAAGQDPALAAGAGALGAAPPSDAQFTREELCRAAGATVEQLLELESFSLVSPRGTSERGTWYGGDDLVLLRLARELADYGLEARHLRMYKLFAEREAALFEQVVAPLVRQRNPEARTRVRETTEALARLGSRMHELALRAAVRGVTEPRDPHR